MSLHPFPTVLGLLLRAGRRTAGRLTGNIRSRAGGGCRFLLGLPALSCAPLLHRSVLLRGRALRLRRVRPGFRFGRVRSLSALLLL